MRKDVHGAEHKRFRLAEGDTPDTVAASLAQRKRWHKGSVEMLLGVKNPRDPDWTPPPAEVPARPVPRIVRCYRKLMWVLFLFDCLFQMAPLLYAAVLVAGCYKGGIFMYLNPYVMWRIGIPRFMLQGVVPAMANHTIDVQQRLHASAEGLMYAPIRLVATLEAIYSKVTGTTAAWGNTGAFGNRSSAAELLVIVLVSSMIVGLGLSVYNFLFLTSDPEPGPFVLLWGFGSVSVSMLWPMARTSVQEAFGWSYGSIDGANLIEIMAPAMLIGLALVMA